MQGRKHQEGCQQLKPNSVAYHKLGYCSTPQSKEEERWRCAQGLTAANPEKLLRQLVSTYPLSRSTH
ncbi:hypothetical protein SLEP1_g39867 [Rubroshorea leprosula]|uniref:Uncharacterized protein n=1 Tax=Rubroshorea leprosula TaxID=152421 RepID=A0AAV5L220_9ROSI|nr:hypothetical protein SLEP1_g39867 [Rubroshorea leprosula]